MKISAFETQDINIDCIWNDSCSDLNVCSKDGDVNINCSGDNTCSDSIFCQDILSLNQICSGVNSCQTTPPTTMSPTIDPTLSPTALTFAPTTTSAVDEEGEDDSGSLSFMGYSVMLMLIALVNN